MRRYTITAADGAPEGDEFLVNQIGQGQQNMVDRMGAVGGSVTWVDHDSANPHNVVSESKGNEFRSPDMDAALPTHDKEFTHTFQAAGTVDYVCEYHPGMVGKVFVVA